MTPLEVLHLIGRQFPGIWGAVDRRAAAAGRTWDASMYAPMMLTGLELIERGAGNQAAAWTPIVHALASWRPTQGIYRYHPRVAEAITSTPLSGDIPVEALTRLPEWCVYIEHGGALDMRGAWVHIEGDELRLVLHSGRDDEPQPRLRVVPIMLGASLDAGIEAAIERLLTTHDAQAGARAYDALSRLRPDIEAIVSLALYLCSERRELAQDGELTTPNREALTRSKRGQLKARAAPAPTIWETAFRLGEAIERAERSQGTGDGSVRPHIRRAHWHAYWVGSESEGSRRRELRWIPPLSIGGEWDVAPTVRNVR